MAGSETYDRNEKDTQDGDRPVSQVGRPRLLLFAAGDFAFNLYWQSAMLYLLFYYTDVLSIAMETAAAIYLV